VHPSLEWVNFSGLVAFADGSPARIGTIVDAYVSPHVRCGTYFVTQPSQYGMMPVYRDDPTTPAKDGALPGDVIRFAVNGLPAVSLGPDPTIWTKNGDYFTVNLLAGAPTQRSFSLGQGWNLISLGLMPSNPEVAAALNSIAGKYTRVLAYDCVGLGQSYYPGLPASLNTLKTLDAFHGYWIDMTMAATLTVVGIQLPAGTPIGLCPGYNLVGYLPQTALPVQTATNSIAGHFTSVMGFDPVLGAQSYYPALPPYLNSLQVMQPGRGYWIYATETEELIYP